MNYFYSPVSKIFWICSLFCALQIQAQDPHFNQASTFASQLNPALVGNYNGSYRLAALYRPQWNSTLSKAGYQTIGADVDFSFLEGYLRHSKLALGVGFMTDRSGQAGLNYTNATISLAYHQGFGKDGNHRLSVGMQGGFIQKRIDDPVYYDEFQGFGNGLGVTKEVYNRGFYNGDLSAGLYWKSNFKDRVKFGIGAGAYHLLEPKENLVRTTFGTFGRQYRKFTADFAMEIFLGKNKKFSISPEFFAFIQGPSHEFNPGLFASYYFQSGFRKNNSLQLGMRARMTEKTGVIDAVIPMVRIEFRNVRLGFGYDVNVSSLSTATRKQGAFEISLSYIGESIKSFKGNKSLPSRRF